MNDCKNMEKFIDFSFIGINNWYNEIFIFHINNLLPILNHLITFEYFWLQELRLILDKILWPFSVAIAIH